MKTNKSSETDNIYTTLLKETKREIVDALKSLFNLFLRQGLVPAHCKTANVNTTIKKGDRSILGHYRPITLTYVCTGQIARKKIETRMLVTWSVIL